MEQRAVDEANSDPPVGGGLDCVVLENRIPNPDLNGNAARTAEGAATDRLLNIADDLIADDMGKQARNDLTLVPGLDAGRNEHWLRPRLLRIQASVVPQFFSGFACPMRSKYSWCRQ